MGREGRTVWWLRADAAISWVLALPGIIDPAQVALFFGAEEPSYSFLVRLWSGLLFMFGCVSWQASRNVRAELTLVRYVWIEKAMVTLIVLAGHLEGEAPPSLMGLIMLTQLPWVPPLLYWDITQRRGWLRSPSPTPDTRAEAVPGGQRPGTTTG